MKTKLFFFILTIQIWVIKSQTVNSSCTGADSIYWKYKKSADKLAIARTEKIGDTYKDSVAINKQISTQYHKALIAVYNATTLPARDTIVFFNITLNYKTLIYSPLNSISLNVDSNSTWLKNLKNNVFPSGNASIDYLITKHYLKKTNYYTYGNTYPYHSIRFNTDTNFNINRLADKFNALFSQGVLGAYPQSSSSDSYNITDSVGVNFTEFTYSIGWGDCMVGCIYRRYWKFKIYNDCSVEYLGSYGNPIPASFFTSVKKEDSEISKVEVFPNPVSDDLVVRFQEGIDSGIKLSIYNSLGEKIFYLKEANSETKINLIALPKGFYFLRIQNGAKENTFKLVKE